MKGQPRTNEEKAYLVLQHLYELATDKDPTGRNPYRMEQEIIHHFEHLAEEYAEEAAEKLMGSDLDMEIVEKVIAALSGKDGLYS